MIDISRKIEQGFSLEKAFRSHKEVFGDFFISIVAVGEQSGTLSRSFNYLADHVERNADMKNRVKKALTYPIFVIAMFIIVIFIILLTVIPQISTILLQSNAELPLITEIVIGLSNFVRDNVFIIVISTLSAIILLIIYFRSEDGRKSLDTFLLNFPLIGRLFKEFYLIRFSNNLNVMLQGGVPIVKALEILSEVMSNENYKQAVIDIETKVKQGSSLSAAIESQKLIDRNIAQIIKIGEETGELSKMLRVIGSFYERQLKSTIDTLLDLIQPTVIVLLGLSVGVLIGSVIVPIYSISSAI